jgi:hypothetical protein
VRTGEPRVSKGRRLPTTCEDLLLVVGHGSSVLAQGGYICLGDQGLGAIFGICVIAFPHKDIR